MDLGTFAAILPLVLVLAAGAWGAWTTREKVDHG